MRIEHLEAAWTMNGQPRHRDRLPDRCNQCPTYDLVCSDPRDGTERGYCLGTGPHGETLTDVVVGDEAPPETCPKRLHRVQ